MLKKIPLTTLMLLALGLGTLFGMLFNYFQWQTFSTQWIAPFGTLFINALKFIAVPLIIISLLNGFAALSDVSRLGKMARKTVLWYLVTTLGAVSLGLLLANLLRPGSLVDESTRQQLLAEQNAAENAEVIVSKLQWLVELIPNLGHINMIALIFTTVVAALAIIRLPETSKQRLQDLFEALNDWVIKIIDFIMNYLGPIGVFALMLHVIAQISTASLLWALLLYGGSVLLGLLLLAFVVYPLLVARRTSIPYLSFLKAIAPAQLVALTTSSSAATLAMTMKCAEEGLGIKKEIVGFCCPLGATANMDGTALYQGIICIFIAQVYGIDLSIGEQFLIIGTVTISSVGAAAVPSGGIAVLAIVLEQVGLPAAGLGLVLALDRPLDMLRTVVNITGDTAVAALVEGKRESR